MKKIIIPVIIIFIFSSVSLFAYIDPGLGSIFFQIAAGGIIGSFLMLKIFGKRVLLFLRKLFQRSNSSDTE